MEVPVRSSILLISTTGYDLRIKGLASVRPFFFDYKCSHAGPRPSHGARLRLRPQLCGLKPVANTAIESKAPWRASAMPLTATAAAGVPTGMGEAHCMMPWRAP